MAGGIRRSLMQSAPAHPFEDGDKTFTTYNNRMVVSNGNKFHGYITGNSHSMLCNISTLSDNSETANDSANNLAPNVFFTVNKGSRVWTRFTPTYVYGSNANIKAKTMNIALRDAAGTSVEVIVPQAAYSSFTVNTPIDHSFIASDDIDIHVVSVYMDASGTAKAQVEGILEIFIDGRRIV